MAALVGGSDAWAQYALQPGDVVEIDVAGVPDLSRTLPVDVDGRIEVPLLGSVEVAGREVEALRAELRERLPALAFRRLAPNGEAVQIALEPEAVGVRVAEYRPIYVEGHVAGPGEQPFRPGLVARQALARAGGDDLAGLRGGDPVLAGADLQAQLGELHLELESLRAARARIEAELAGRSEIDVMGGGFAGRMAEREGERLQARQARMERDREALRLERARLDEQLHFLREQLEKERAAVEADERNEARVRDSYDRGLAPLRQLADAERLTFSSGARATAVSAQIAEVGRELEALKREESRLEDDRRVELAEEARGIEARLPAIRAQAEAAAAKLAHLGGLGAGVLAFGSGDMDVIIHRGSDVLAAGLDTPLEPGDVVSFRFSPGVLEDALGLASAEAPLAAGAP